MSGFWYKRRSVNDTFMKSSGLLPLLVFVLLTHISNVWADTKYSVSGCVIDGAGKPAIGVKIVARRADAELFGKTNGAETKKPTGCYEIRNLSAGAYWISVRDSAFDGEWLGPVQAKIDLYSKSVEGINLTTALPNPDSLRAGILRSLKSARSGFGSEIVNNVAPYYADLGTGRPASILSGFGECTIHYQNGGGGATAGEVCTVRGFKKETSAVAAFMQVESVIDAALGALDVGYKSSEGSTTCDGDCKAQSGWISPTHGAVFLRREDDKRLNSHYRVQLWLVYNQRISADGCAAAKRGESIANDSVNGKYEMEVAGITSAIMEQNERYQSFLKRNILRLALTGGDQESAPAPMPMAQYPQPDSSTACARWDRP